MAVRSKSFIISLTRDHVVHVSDSFGSDGRVCRDAKPHHEFSWFTPIKWMRKLLIMENKRLFLTLSGGNNKGPTSEPCGLI